MSRRRKVVVIGAGIGGMACAVSLACRGVEVLVLEKAARPGGKASGAELGGAEFDAGPTVLTMPWVFDELFAEGGQSFRSVVSLKQAEILARHAWLDGTTLDLHADRRASADAISAVFGPDEARRYLAFCEYGRRIFETTEKPFLRSQRPTMTTIAKQFGTKAFSALATIDSHRSMWRALEDSFESPKLRQLFGRYATYVGSSPFDAPATLNLISYVESEGVYQAIGGMRSVARALLHLATSLGVEFRYGTSASRIDVKHGRAEGVVDAHGDFIPADAVVFNGDASALGSSLLGEAAAKAAPVTAEGSRSLSAVTWIMHARTEGFPLDHHNVFFSSDYATEFSELMRARHFPSEPTVYICAQDRDSFAESRVASDATERLLVLINAPATGDQPALWTEANKARALDATLRVLSRAGLRLTPASMAPTSPLEYHQRFAGTGGALYGPRAKNALSAMTRPGAVSKVGGLFLAGGSVHPGPGVPMAALSGRLAASAVQEFLGS